MTDIPRSGRRYTDKQVGQLIQRATELHDAESGSSDHSLSLQEVEKIASELGISTEHVLEAADEIDMGELLTDKFSLFGGPFREQVSKVVEGELTDQQWEDIVLELRRITGGSGKSNQIGRIREWSRVIKDMDMTLHGMQITLRPKNGETTIDIEKHFGFLAGFAFLMSGLAGFFLTGLALSANGFTGPLIAFLSLFGGIGTLATTRTLLSMWRHKHQKRLQAYAKLIASKIKPTAAAAVKEVSVPESIAPHERLNAALMDGELMDGDEFESLESEASAVRPRQKS